MPRTKSVPVAKRNLPEEDNLIDDTLEESISVVVAPKTVRRPKSRKKVKKEYEFAIEPEFEQFLSDANFFLTIHLNEETTTGTNDLVPDSCHCQLGSFEVGVVSDRPLQTFFERNHVNNQQIYIYTKQSPFEALLYYECNESKTGKHFSIDFTSNCNSKFIGFNLIDAIRSSQFYLTSRLEPVDNQLSIDVWLLKTSLKQLDYHSQTFGCIRHEVLLLMNFFYDFPLPTQPSDNEASNESVENLYSRIKAKHIQDSNNIIRSDVQHPALRPTLRFYQMEAAQWMLQRERIQTIGSHQIVFDEIKTKDGKTVHYNKYLGYFADGNTFPVKYIYGIAQSGILADEMGLGKTIEVLSCILCNPKPSFDESLDNYFLNDDVVEDTIEDVYLACVCGEICDIDYFRRKNAIISSEDYNSDQELTIENDNRSVTAEDSDNTIENDEDYQKLLDQQNVKQLVITRRINGKPFVKKIERKSKKRTINTNKLKKKPKPKLIVQCRSCGSYQHSSCVNYDHEKRRPYYCGHCWVKEGMKPVESRGTLIVSPRSISHQWQEEITKHVDCSNLDIYVYEGVKSNTGYVQPFDLANNDIVLTTYETLRSEIDFVNLQHSNKFRYPKRFNSTPSPLLAVNWWRICLDEAQMVESASAKTAQMAHRLYGRHRWCITGTPIQKSINDIYGLLLFIGEEPYHERLYWETMLYWPYTYGNSEPMVTALSKCFWRTSKKDVWDQLGIPAQTSSQKILKFSPVEKHFYMRQHTECQRKFNEKMLKFSDLNIKLKSLDRKTANIVMIPLLSLRQACCHPQAVRGKFLPISKKTLTMEELLKNMIKNTQYECEDDHRKVISSLNGIAAIHIIEEDYEKAIDFYRKALTSIENYKAKDLFRTDKLQQYHTLYNLADILDKCGIKQKDKTNDQFYNKENENQTSITISVDIGRTLRDEYLKYESIQINDEYLAKGTATITEVTKQLEPFVKSVSKLTNSFKMTNDNPWWRMAIINLKDNGEEFNLISRVKEALEHHDLRGGLDEQQLSKFVSIATNFRECVGLIYVLDKCLRELHQSRMALKQRVKHLNAKPSESELNEAIDCHLRPIKDKEGNRAESVVKCKYCRIHELFNDYEMKLYYFSAEEKVEESKCKSVALMEKQRRGNWGDSETEQCLKVIHHLYRIKFPGATLILDDAKNHLKLFEALKKEFRGLRAIWTEIYDFVSLIDELNMATIRLRLRFKDEPKPQETITYILEEHEVAIQLETLKSDEVIARNALAKKLSHLYYLNNLSKDDSYKKGGRNPEMCPICQNPMDEQWAVLQCGHCVCVKCLDILIDGYSRNTANGLCIHCALCRELCPISAILYVNSSVDEEESNAIEVNGSWSTKIEEVVRCLLTIVKEDPSTKSLVFSTWNDVLQLISNAFTDNKISHCFIKNASNFSRNIDNFKQDKDIRALLMPMELGSKGLNLIEATHVILVEPTLNRANEQQAVGRVHRIGQTKPTFVHRFVVENTIEERIHYLFSDTSTEESNSLQLAEKSEHACITLSQMKKLFESQ